MKRYGERERRKAFLFVAWAERMGDGGGDGGGIVVVV